MAGGDLQSFYGLLERTPDERRRHFETMIDRVHAIIRIMRRMPQPVDRQASMAPPAASA